MFNKWTTCSRVYIHIDYRNHFLQWSKLKLNHKPSGEWFHCKSLQRDTSLCRFRPWKNVVDLFYNTITLKTSDELDHWQISAKTCARQIVRSPIFLFKTAEWVTNFASNAPVNTLQLAGLGFWKFAFSSRHSLRHFMVYTLIDHSSRPISVREFFQLLYIFYIHVRVSASYSLGCELMVLMQEIFVRSGFRIFC